MTEVKRIISEIDQSDPQVAEQMLPLLYDELRRLAAQKLAAEKPGQTLDATGLVHEVYLRLFGSNTNPYSLETRGQFLAAAARAIRNILIDRARRRNAMKRGGGLERQHLDMYQLSAPLPADESLALHDALERLAELDPIKAKLVELRYFAGLTGEEAAHVLDISPATADRYWAYARAWLQTEVRDR